MAGEFHLRVVTPQRTIFDRKVKAVTFMGVDGSYGILPDHAPLMTATRPGIMDVTEMDGTTDQILVTDGFAEMRHNVLAIVTESGELAHEIDLERALIAEQRAREKMAEHTKIDIDLPRAEAALQRALLRQLLGRKRSGSGHV